jgi:glycerol-3-phosphate cytidylyltransferase
MPIKYYYPNMKIEFFSYDTNIKIIPFLNHVNILHVKNEDIYNYYNDSKFIYINKPIIDFIRLITFGTFDLFHIGHEKIFERCLNYSDYIIVGISSDEFTFSKKQIIPTDNFETRRKNVFNCKNVKDVFSEESMELKNEYIKQFNAHILIMGDDWKDKFNWVDCSVIYLERTPDISSTMLRNIAQTTKID